MNAHLHKNFAVASMYDWAASCFFVVGIVCGSHFDVSTHFDSGRFRNSTLDIYFVSTLCFDTRYCRMSTLGIRSIIPFEQLDEGLIAIHTRRRSRHLHLVLAQQLSHRVTAP